MAAPEQPPTTPVLALRPTSEPSIVVLAISGSISRADVSGLCREAHELLAGHDIDVVICDIVDVADIDAVTVDALARLQLTARRLGCRIRLRHAGEPVQELLALTGLGSVVPTNERLSVQLGRQAEQREEASGVEEEADPGDRTA